MSAAAVAAGEAEVAEEGGDIIEELEELEEAAGEEAGEAGEESGPSRRRARQRAWTPAVWRGSMPVGLERMTRWPIFSKARTMPEMWTASAPVPRVRKW